MQFLEVIFALSFIYFLASVIASGINEAISMLFNKRGLELKRAIRLLLNSDACDWGDRFYSHPKMEEFKEAPSRISVRAVPQRLYNWIFRKKETVKFNPSYVAANQFSEILVEFISQGAEGPDPNRVSTTLDPEEIAFIGQMRRFISHADAFNFRQFVALYLDGSQPEYRVLDYLRRAVEGVNTTDAQAFKTKVLGTLDLYVEDHNTMRNKEHALEHLRSRVIELQENPNFSNFQQFLGLSSTFEEFKGQLETWFNAYMDRVSGWYKRRMHVTIFWIAALITVIGNIDSIEIIQNLIVNQQFRETVVNAAEDYIASHPEEFSHAATFEAQMDSIKSHISLTRELFLPVGLETDKGLPGLKQILGWLLSIMAISLGAPFWFDMLNKIARLRAAGKKPEENPA